MTAETFPQPHDAFQPEESGVPLDNPPLAPDQQRTVIGQHPVQPDPEEWGYTSKAEDVIRLRQELEARRGATAVRETIGRDSTIAEGVYEGRYGGEAIVVDYNKDPTLIDQTVDEVLSASISAKTGKVDKNNILGSVFSVVSRRMPYNSEAVDRIFQQDLGGRDGQKVSLSYYIGQGVGECRHQALYAGVVLERIKAMGYLRGTASVDRNMIKSGPDGKYDGHAWVRYTNSGGEVFIIDVAQQQIGTLEDMMKARELNPRAVWDYARPEDKRKYAGDALWMHKDQENIDTVERKPVDLTPYMDERGVIYRTPWSDK
jgi:hypothetical protein